MTASKPDTELPIDVRGAIRLDGPAGRPVRFEAEGSRLILAAPGWVELDGLAPRSFATQRRALAATIRMLKRLDLTLAIEIAGRPSLGFGAGVRTTLLARLLGLTSAHIPVSTVYRYLRARAAAAE